MSILYSLKDVTELVKNLAPRKNILLFYDDLEVKKEILISYLLSSINKGHLGIYIAGEESLKQMEAYIIKHSKELIDKGLLKILDWSLLHHKLHDWHILIEDWGKLIEECIEKNLKSPRVCSEMSALYRYLQSKKLIECEEFLHEKLEILNLGICSYSIKTLVDGKEYDMLDLIRIHEYTIIAGSKGAFFIYHQLYTGIATYQL